MLPLNLDVFVPDGPAFLWFRLVPSDGEDLQIQECGTRQRGEAPEWFTYETRETDWTMIVGCEWHQVSFRTIRYSEQWVRWALKHGIAPRQPFLIKMEPPHYSQHETDCGTEYDVDYDCRVVYVAPQPHEKTTEAWAKFFKRRTSHLEAREKYAVRVRQERDLRTEKMFLSSWRYYVDGDRYYHDDMGWPSGLNLTLCTNHEGWCELANGRSDKGDHEEALRDLIAKAVLRFPNIDAGFLRGLKTR